MRIPPRFARPLAVLLAAFLPFSPLHSQQAEAEQSAPADPVASIPLPVPTTLKPDDPWLYRGTDIPHDQGWLFGELDNGLRYAVRENQVPGGQISIRVRIDAGSLHEEDSEQGFAHLIEHLTFRESKYLANGEAIPTWQRLGARLGTDTNASTTPTETVFKIDLPEANRVKLDQSLKLISGMIREPALSEANLAAEVPIVLAELRENSGPARHVFDATRELYYKGQRLAERSTVGTVETLQGATSESVRGFHDRWYRPENTVIVIVGDGPPEAFAGMIERYFADWEMPGEPDPEPDFGKPTPPPGVDPDNPVGAVKVLVEPALPRGVTWAMLRPWGKPTDNLEYNRGLMLDRVAEAIINRRLEEAARKGGNYLLANVEKREVSRSVNGTFVSVTPLGPDWKSAVHDVRAVIADALATPPSQAEIDREVAEIDVAFANMYQQRINQQGTKLADELVGAVDIREAVASPETFLTVFRDMNARFTPDAVFEHTQDLFEGDVTRAFLLAPEEGEATEEDLRAAMLRPVEPDSSARLSMEDLSFDDLPPVGTPHEALSRRDLNLLGIEQLDYSNDVHAMIWRTENEPGRVTVRVRFGSGYRAFSAEEAPYIALGQMALVSSGVGPLGESELDAIATGRKLGFNFSIEDGTFVFEAETRQEDVADQLYLFASKLAQPRWDERPIQRAKAGAKLSYQSHNADPTSVINSDLEWLLTDKDPRFATITPEQIDETTPEGFRNVWEDLLRQGPVEVMVFGDIDKEATVSALSRTFGALPPREPIPAEALARGVTFPEPQADPVVLHHGGEADQAAAVVAWPLGGGVEGLPVSRELEILGDVFTNRLLDAMREQAGASYMPFVSTSWPVDIDSGGKMMAIAQMPPAAVPQFFEVADRIAQELAATGPTEDELQRVTEPFRQVLSRVVNGHIFWMNMVEGASTDPRRLEAVGTVLPDYTVTTPERMKELAARYLASRDGWRVAVLPEGQDLP